MKPTRALTPDRIVRFWAKVDRRSDDECWEWIAGRNAAGYGQFRVAGAGVSPAHAHRVSYEILVGNIPDGLQLDHLCRNRGCVNPHHLEPVSGRVNTLRGVGPTAINAARTHCKRGHEFTPENTIIHPLGRNCRKCQAITARARREARASEGVPSSPCQNH
ncbi:HNH endonuclease signature motif containing protein [Microbacterium sp. WCS2018Hpa-9]|uniref:HNH endonuclease signature motif containing protein n=1 Tax=Microbacterium sp. WCS2018Hpa-9 TaxID=3073635 RepID=UPI0037CB7058